MEAKREDEVRWWELEFSTRFVANNLPRRDTPLYGHRFVLFVETPDGLQEWREGK